MFEETYIADQTDNGPEDRRSNIGLLIFILVLFSALMVAYGLYNSSQYETNLADKLEAQFHGVLAEQDLQRIYSESDQQFKKKYTQDSAVAMFANISTRYGTPGSSRVISKRMRRSTDGSYLYANFDTTFTTDQKAIERITWHETDGVFRLDDYDIEPETK